MLENYEESLNFTDYNEKPKTTTIYNAGFPFIINRR